ncbi:putative gustatory receptor 89a [Drosophila santomea]|uniref:putative gustatory receptor 89a n=1 Tax=Drosophila santomea TaxID=129105 RepID=UPI0019537832|nr:putative gustatory receptor 89a [Drosophila santomea]
MSRLPHVCGLCLLLRFWQLLALAPFRLGGTGQRWVTLIALLRLLLLTAMAPLVLWKSAAMYEATNVRHSTAFKTIALATMTGDVCIALALLASHLLHRRELGHLVNDLARLHRRTRLSWWSTLFLWLKLLLSLYDLLCSVPFLKGAGARLPWSQLVAYGVQLYFQHVASVYGNGVFGGTLLMLECYAHLEREEPNLARLLKKEASWWRLTRRFVKVFQLGIFLLVFGSFVNIMVNIYAFMSYYVSLHGVPLTISNNCLVLAIQLFAVILAAHFCQLKSAKLRTTCLQLQYVPEGLTQEQAMASTPFPLLSPTGNAKFRILGVFILDNSFWLFLVSYAMNFIVVILQTSFEHINHGEI